MQTKDFYFDLPDELIAQYPSKIRGNDKLMVLDRCYTAEKNLDETKILISHKKMQDLLDLIDKDTVMVFNNSKVRRIRCYAIKESSGNQNEFMILNTLQGFLSKEESLTKSVWKCMIKNAKKQKVGNTYKFSDGTLATVIENKEDLGTEFRTVLFNKVLDENWFEQNGHIPLPPYIKREDSKEDGERYQNVYATETGSAACPTAGLHFTNELLQAIKDKGVQTEYVTLHVGLGTFLPVRVDNIIDHKMHEEYFSIDEDTARRITLAKHQGKKILAVGTTSVRTLESAWNEEEDKLISGTHSTRIFIYPGYKCKVIDQLFTNFHTPESTLMMLVSALAGKDNILRAYKNAVEEKYRFFSYGDAMLIR